MTRGPFSFLKHPYYWLGGTLAKLFFKASRALPLPTASRLGAWLGQTFGPYNKASKIAQRNIHRVFPQYSAKKRAHILKEMWGNLGRIPTEYAHMETFLSPQEQWRIQIDGKDILEKLRDDGKPAILFAGHLGHWQMATLAARLQGLEVIQLTRPANNPWFNQVMQEAQFGATKGIIPKGPQGARTMVKALQQGEHLFVLVDQKMNDGISVPFLGYPAMTAPAIARLAQKFQCPLVPVRVERLVEASFRVTFLPPLDVEKSAADVMKDVNNLLGQWVMARPEQWFWVHNRWPTGPSSKKQKIL